MSSLPDYSGLILFENFETSHCQVTTENGSTRIRLMSDYLNTNIKTSNRTNNNSSAASIAGNNMGSPSTQNKKNLRFETSSNAGGRNSPSLSTSSSSSSYSPSSYANPFQDVNANTLLNSTSDSVDHINNLNKLKQFFVQVIDSKSTLFSSNENLPDTEISVTFHSIHVVPNSLHELLLYTSFINKTKSQSNVYIQVILQDFMGIKWKRIVKTELNVNKVSLYERFLIPDDVDLITMKLIFLDKAPFRHDDFEFHLSKTKSILRPVPGMNDLEQSFSICKNIGTNGVSATWNPLHQFYQGIYLIHHPQVSVHHSEKVQQFLKQSGVNFYFISQPGFYDCNSASQIDDNVHDYQCIPCFTSRLAPITIDDKDINQLESDLISDTRKKHFIAKL